MTPTIYTLRRAGGDPRAWTAEAGGIAVDTGHDLGVIIERIARQCIEAGQPFPAFALDINPTAETAARKAAMRAELQRYEHEQERALAEARTRAERIAYLKSEIDKP